jgi:hypothetical protein
MGLSATVLSNNMAASFVVTSLEDYFKSTFVALLRYSPNKRSFFKSHMLKGDHLAAISDAKSSVEDQVAETMSFQNIAAVCRLFEKLPCNVCAVAAGEFFERLFDLCGITHEIRLSRGSPAPQG